MSYRTVYIPLPTHRLALSALRALQVDVELSPLVCRSLSLVTCRDREGSTACGTCTSDGVGNKICNGSMEEGMNRELCVKYQATTNRMLRVAVNGFMESLGIILGVMEELDVDMLP